MRTVCLLLSLLLGCCLGGMAGAHDPSAWGGIYRTRDAGANWLPADANLFIGAALDLAVSRADPGRLLYATDTRLLRSANGGRDWHQEAPQLFIGAVHAVCFLDDGAAALAANASGLFRSAGPGAEWQPVELPASALPVRTLLATGPGQVWLGGAHGALLSTDGGHRFVAAASGLPDAPVLALAHLQAPVPAMLAVAAGGLWRSTDDGAHWTPAGAGLPATVDVVAPQAGDGGRVWLAGSDRLYRSADGGAHWEPVAGPLPEPGTSVRGIGVAAGGLVILLTTHRGLLRSADGGRSWSGGDGNLPIHLEAGPLIADPADPSTFYVSYSLTPYAEHWRRAVGGGTLPGAIDGVSLAGGAAFLALLGAAAMLLVRRLRGLPSLPRT